MNTISQINCHVCTNQKICKINEMIKKKYGTIETYQKCIAEILNDHNIPLLTLSISCGYFTTDLNDLTTKVRHLDTADSQYDVNPNNNSSSERSVKRDGILWKS